MAPIVNFPRLLFWGINVSRSQKTCVHFPGFNIDLLLRQRWELLFPLPTEVGHLRIIIMWFPHPTMPVLPNLEIPHRSSHVCRASCVAAFGSHRKRIFFDDLASVSSAFHLFMIRGFLWTTWTECHIQCVFLLFFP